MTLRKLRESQGLSREQLSRLLGITATTIYRIETGRHRPNFDSLQKLTRWARSRGEELTWGR